MKKTVIKHLGADGKPDGREICLAETNDIKTLERQYMLLGMQGLAYSPWAREIQEKIKRLKKKKEGAKE